MDAVLEQRHIQTTQQLFEKSSSRHLVYGEVGSLCRLAKQLAGVGAKPSFLDVGAGLGRLVWQVAILCPQFSLVKRTEIVRRRTAHYRVAMDKIAWHAAHQGLSIAPC